MKKVIITVFILVIVLFGGLFYITRANDIYKQTTLIDNPVREEEKYAVYFSSPLCEQCKIIEPQVLEFFKQNQDNPELPLYTINMEESKYIFGEDQIEGTEDDLKENPDQTTFIGLSSNNIYPATPLLLVIENGKVVQEGLGSVSEDEEGSVLNLIKKLMESK